MNTTSTPGDNPKDEEPDHNDFREILREKFQGLDDPENQKMTEGQFKELSALSEEERASRLSKEQAAEFEEFKKIWRKVGDRLARQYVKTVFPGYRPPQYARLLEPQFKNIGLTVNMPNLGLRRTVTAPAGLALPRFSGNSLNKLTDAANTSFLDDIFGFQEPKNINPFVGMVTQTILAGAGLNRISGLMKFPVMSTFQSTAFQQFLARPSTPENPNLLSTSPTINHLIGDIAGYLHDNEGFNENFYTAPSVKPVLNEQILENAWWDIEKVLSTDENLRRVIEDNAQQLAPQTDLRKEIVLALLAIIVFTCGLIPAWSDGEMKVDDFTEPIVVLAGALSIYIEKNQNSGKNLLQKNGPRRRRHRRKKKK